MSNNIALDNIHNDSFVAFHLTNELIKVEDSEFVKVDHYTHLMKRTTFELVPREWQRKEVT